MNKFFIACLLTFMLSRPVNAGLFNAHEWFLDNGLHVVVVENHKAPLIKHMVWYKAGKVDEALGKGGSAHLLEHLMFRGSKHVKDGDFNAFVNKYGIDANAFTSYDTTVYHQFADISKLELLMALEADRMENLSFDKQAFEAERKIVYQERKQVVENNPNSAFGERFNFLLWGKTPYGHPITGLNEEINNLQYEDIYDFYNRYYAPNNAILILSGDITPKQAEFLAEKYYGGIDKKKIIKKKQSDIVENYSETLSMKQPDIKSEKFVIKYLLPHYDKLEGNLYNYLVLAAYLGDGETSALYRDMVVNRQVAIDVAVSYNFLTGINSVFAVSVLPREDSAEEIAKILSVSMEDAVRNLDGRKLEKTKKKMLSDLVYVNDNPSDAAYWIGHMLVHGFTLDEIQKYEENINNVKVQDVQRAFKNLLQSSSVKGTLSPLE